MPHRQRWGSGKGDVRTMKSRHVITAAAIVAFLALLALPAAAALDPADKAAAIDPGLKDELWAIHTDHRLDIYDRNVEAAGQAIDALQRYGYPVSGLTATLDSIKEFRDDLASALESRDREELRTINRELFSLWKDFRQEMKGLLRGE
jgi:hypothetical protein